MAARTAETDSAMSLGGDLKTAVEGGGVALAEFDTERCDTCNRMRPTLELATDTDATAPAIHIETNLETAAREPDRPVTPQSDRPVSRLTHPERNDP